MYYTNVHMMFTWSNKNMHIVAKCGNTVIWQPLVHLACPFGLMFVTHIIWLIASLLTKLVDCVIGNLAWTTGPWVSKQGKSSTRTSGWCIGNSNFTHTKVFSRGCSSHEMYQPIFRRGNSSGFSFRFRKLFFYKEK